VLVGCSAGSHVRGTNALFNACPEYWRLIALELWWVSDQTYRHGVCWRLLVLSEPQCLLLNFDGPTQIGTYAAPNNVPESSRYAVP